MKNKYLIYLAILALPFSIKCQIVMSSYCTTTAGIFKLERGQSLSDVSAALASEPTDYYYIYENKYKVVTYMYRKNFQEIARNKQYNSESLRGGKSIYIDEQTLYVVLDAATNKLVYYMTDEGRKNSAKEINLALLNKIRK